LLNTRSALPLHGTAATRALERAAAAGLPEFALMARAGLAVAQLALALAPHARRIWIACGPGNNGGDGLEAASHLQRWGLHPCVTWLGSETRLPADAALALSHARAAGVPFGDAPPDDLGPLDLGIDALLGIGASRAPTGSMAQWLEQLRNGAAPLLAVDIPSGLDADTGALYADNPTTKSSNAGRARHAPRHTLSLLTLKPGLFTAHGRDVCGTVWFDDLGVRSPSAPPDAWLSATPPPRVRPHASHKGSFGDVAIIGGQDDPGHGTSMMGAALLAATAALHAGAGRVYVSLLGAAVPRLSGRQPELMFRDPGALPLEQLTVVCGCGGGDAVRAPLPAILQHAAKLVLDADALNAVATDPALQSALTSRAQHGQATILTPHPLEAARLLSTNAQAGQSERLRAAQVLAERFGCVVVLKGSGSVIAAPGETPHINPSGNARLATAGTGDVLAGLTGARLALGADAFEAACAAVFEHGTLADHWPDDRTLTAGTLAERLMPAGGTAQSALKSGT
jgi:hydroxyethylthiazole kinase-like uncharacterized protein yjeF